MTYSIGVDLHRNYSQVCVLEERGEKIAERRLYHDDEREMRQFLAQYPEGTGVAVEATRGWMWLPEMLEDARLEVHLAHSMGVRLIAESRLKTDKVDAWALAQLLRTGFLPESYLAPHEVRDRRMLLRHREALVEGRTKMKNRVHGLLARYNIRLQATDIFGNKGMRMLRCLELPAHGLRVLHDLLDYVEYTNGQIKRLEQYLKDVLGSDQRVEWLVTMPGIGRLSAYYLIAEIGEIGRFPSAEKLVSYAGLCPSTRSSGGKTHHGSTRGGRRLIKWVLVEAAHTAVRRDSYFASFFHRLKRRKGKQIAYVATAHKMAKVIWHMLTEQRAYEPKGKRSQVGSTGGMAVRH